MNPEQLLIKTFKNVIREIIKEELEKEREYERGEERVRRYLLSLLGN